MHLTDWSQGNGAALAQAGIQLPAFDRAQMMQATLDAPTWVHFGLGNIFRAFPAAVLQALLNAGLETCGVIAAEGYDYEIVDLLRANDLLSLLVTLKADGTIDKTLIASLAAALKADPNEHEDYAALKRIFRAPSLQMASFTITEKGYSLTRGDGALMSDVATDLKKGPGTPLSYMGKVTALLYERYLAGGLPLALVSMDNCSHNGSKLHAAVRAFAEGWARNRRTEAQFLAYVDDGARVSYPWTMIDKITPRPDEGVSRMLLERGFDDVTGTVTAKRTYVAPFVNAEETQYLVVEDWFPNGRPKLDAGGVIFTDRETVDKVERMKVCTCLNPLHTAMALFGCLLGYERISDEMRDADIAALVKGIGYDEGLPVVTDPGVLSPRAFLDQVVNARLVNPFMPDTPQRIACDTSQKLAIRFGVTIKAYGARAQELTLIPLTLAAWCRYLMGVDDAGRAFELSPDPMLDEVRGHVAQARLGDAQAPVDLKPLLSDARIFGVDLYDVGLGERIEASFRRMCTGPGAVREALHEAVCKEG